MELEADGNFAVRVGVVSEASGDRTVVLHADGSRMSTLSPTGSLIWQRLPGSLDELAAAVSERFPDVAPAVIRADVARFVEEMLDAGLIVGDDARG